MVTLTLLLFIPLIWPMVAKYMYGHSITWGEMALNMLLGALIVIMGWYGASYWQMADTEILNGEVTSKNFEHVSCEHSYSCNCRDVCTGSGKDRSCSTTCDTCYEHSYDVDWLVHGNIGKVTIARVDRRGLAEPEAFSRARIGEPMALEHTYVNYVKGAQNSLFNTAQNMTAVKQFENKLPEYPRVVDYYRAQRFMSVGLNVPNASQWGASIANHLKVLGPLKQSNLLIIATSESDPKFSTALKAKWLNGKKNDILVILGAPAYPNVAWVDISAWTDNESFKVQLRDSLMQLGTMENPDTVLNLIDTYVRTQYQRKPMQDYEYLRAEIDPPMWLIIMLALIGAGSSVAISRLFKNNSYTAR